MKCIHEENKHAGNNWNFIRGKWTGFQLTRYGES